MCNTETNAKERDAVSLEEELKVLEEELYLHYCQTGKSLLEIADAENREIDRLVNKIVEIKQAVAAVKEQVTCPSCFAQNDNDSLFCKKCGQEIESR